MVDHFPALSFGPVGISVSSDGEVIIVRNNVSDESDDNIAYAMERAEAAALDMGYVKRAVTPDHEDILMSIWGLDQVS
jgi:hypothetical protein